MNEIVKNAQSFVEVLQNSRGDAVKFWDISALQRAIDWAKYFEEVYIKLKDKPKAVDQIDKKLKLICSLPGAAIGDNIISVENFNQSQQLLLKNLIQNPHLTHDIFGQVLKQYTLLFGSNSESGFETFVEDASECIQAKSSRIFLQNILLNFHTKDDLSPAQVNKEQTNILNARLLRRFLVHHHSNSPCAEKTIGYLNEILHRVASQEYGMIIIALTISLPPDTRTDEKQSLRACEEFIFEWIQKNKMAYATNTKE